MGTTSERWRVIGTGGTLGCLLSGFTAATQLPPEAGAGDRLVAFAGMMAGPLCASFVGGWEGMAHSPIAGWLVLGFLSAPLIAAHPVKPSAATACVSVIGLAGWFWTGFLTLIYSYYAG